VNNEALKFKVMSKEEIKEMKKKYNVFFDDQPSRNHLQYSTENSGNS